MALATQSLVPWTGNQQGQTLNSTYSVALVGGDRSGMLLIQGHLYQTNLPNTQFQLAYKVDGSAPTLTPVIFTTDSQGNGDFAFSTAQYAVGAHTVTVELNEVGKPCFYVNSAGGADATTGIACTITSDNQAAIGSGHLKQVSMGSPTNIWGLDGANNIYQYNGSTWTQIPGQLVQVSVAPNGTVCGVNADGTIHRYNGNQTWTQLSGTLAQVSVVSASEIFGVSTANAVFSYRGDQANSWAPLSGTMQWVSCASDQTMYGIDPAGNVFWFSIPNSRWNQIAGSPSGHPFVSISVGSVNYVYAIDAVGSVFQYGGGTDWIQTSIPPVTSFSATANGSCAFTNMQGGCVSHVVH